MRPTCLVDLEAAILRVPAVKRLLAEPVPPAEVGRLRARLRLLQDPDDLLFREPAFGASRAPPRGHPKPIPHRPRGGVFGEQVAWSEPAYGLEGGRFSTEKSEGVAVIADDQSSPWGSARYSWPTLRTSEIPTHRRPSSPFPVEQREESWLSSELWHVEVATNTVRAASAAAKSESNFCFNGPCPVPRRLYSPRHKLDSPSRGSQ